MHAHSQTTYAPVPQTLPNNITYRDQIFDGSVSGLRDYMESMRNSSNGNESIYNKLNPELKTLESQNLWGNVLMWGGIGVGLAVTTIPLASMSSSSINMAPVYAGLGIMTAGVVAGLIIKPGRKELMNFLNQHNRVNKSTPLKWSIGFSPMVTIPGFVSTLALNF